jgi:uncharacterized protein (TIGR02145 family)
MKRILFASIAVILAINLNAQQTVTLTDSRDGKTYKTVKISNQIWMAENLAHKPASGNYWAYDNNQSNVAKYGYLYDWQTACNVCPTGWHLPSDAECTHLTDFLGRLSGTKLKAKNGWSNNGNGTDDYGFSVLPGGYRIYPGSFYGIEDLGRWWSSYGSDHIGRDRIMANYYGDVTKGIDSKPSGFSVRCLRD